MSGPALPGYLDGLTPTASMDRGCRTISWTLPPHGALYRNTYTHAWVTVQERTPWSGEPLSVWCHRRTEAEPTFRVSFTDAANRLIKADVLPPVARYGFARWWIELHGGQTSGEAGRRKADRERIRAQWWEMCGDLADMHAFGLLELKGSPQRTTRASYGRWVLTLCDSHRGLTRTPVVASAWVDGEQVGWMTESGSIVPMEGVLDGA